MHSLQALCHSYNPSPGHKQLDGNSKPAMRCFSKHLRIDNQMPGLTTRINPIVPTCFSCLMKVISKLAQVGPLASFAIIRSVHPDLCTCAQSDGLPVEYDYLLGHLSVLVGLVHSAIRISWRKGPPASQYCRLPTIPMLNDSHLFSKEHDLHPVACRPGVKTPRICSCGTGQ